MLTRDRTVLETVVNVATSMPFVLVGLQTARATNILYGYSYAGAKKLVDVVFKAVTSIVYGWLVGCLLVLCYISLQRKTCV